MMSYCVCEGLWISLLLFKEVLFKVWFCFLNLIASGLCTERSLLFIVKVFARADRMTLVPALEIFYKTQLKFYPNRIEHNAKLRFSVMWNYITQWWFNAIKPFIVQNCKMMTNASNFLMDSLVPNPHLLSNCKTNRVCVLKSWLIQPLKSDLIPSLAVCPPLCLALFSNENKGLPLAAQLLSK